MQSVQIAQTNLQLYNQLRAKAVPLEDLIVVHRAYELLTSLYTGQFQADGKPFVAHGVGVASILAELEQPPELLAVGLLHNVYGNADFGDGRRGLIRSHRRLVRAAVGERIEQLIALFPRYRLNPRTIEEFTTTLSERNHTERELILIDLADHLEKYNDLGVLYFGEDDWILSGSEALRGDLVEIARSLGEPRLAEMLSAAIGAATAQRGLVPAELRPSDGRRYAKLIVPLSCRRRTGVRIRLELRLLRGSLRPRTRWRQWRHAGGPQSRAST